MNASDLLEHFNESQWLYYIQRVDQKGTSHVAYAVSMVVIFFAGMVGNIVTCLVIYRDRSMHTVTNYYLFNLAVSDLVVLLAMLGEVTYYSGRFPYPMDVWGDMVCKVHAFVVVALWNNGILIMTAVAVERYVAIVHPLVTQARRVRRRVARVMAAVWSLAVLETLPDVFTMKLIHTRRSPVCFVTLSWYTRVVNTAAAVVTFLLPLAVMTYVYIAIAITVNARQKNTYGDNIFNHRNNRKKVNKLIIALTLSFLVCWVPYFSLRVTVAFGDVPTLVALAQYWELWYEVVSVSAWFSSVLNPLIFSLMSTKFRKALKALWYATLLRRKIEHVPVLV